MVQRAASLNAICVPLGKEGNPLQSSGVVWEEDETDEDPMTDESLVTDWKKKRVRSSRLKMSKPKRCEKQRQSDHFKKRKEDVFKNVRSRWSTERYERAERCMLEIMKTREASLGNKIERPALRLVARKQIGDTGLLDHLLKHMDGKVAPGGTERFRRCYNPNGVMEYWLESADLVNLRHEAGVKDPFWIPQPMGKPEELKLLKAEMDKMKRDVEELISKKQREDQPDLTPDSSSVNTNLKLDGSFQLSLQNLSSDKEMHASLLVWKVKTEQQLMEICTSLSSLQGMHKELERWKDTVEQRLREVSNSHSKKRNDLGPWFESSDLMNFQPDDIAPWLDGADLNIQGDAFPFWLESDDLVKIEPEIVQNPCMVKIEHEATVQDEVMQDPCVVKIEDEVLENPCTVKLEGGAVQKPRIINVEDEIVQTAQNPCLISLKEDMVKIRRDVQDLVVPEREAEDKAIYPPNSSISHCSRLDLDDSLRLLQEMYEGSVKWKAKIEQQVTEISNSLGSFIKAN